MPDRGPAIVRLRLPYEDAEAFTARFPRHCPEGQLYLPTRRTLAEGEAVRFELLTRAGERLLLGEGTVASSARPVGFLVAVRRLDPSSRALWERAFGGRRTESGAVAEPMATPPAPPPPPGGVATAEVEAPAAPAPAEVPVLAIDLGSARVLAAVVLDGRTHVLALDGEGPGMPAVLGAGDQRDVLVGDDALRRRIEQPEQTVVGARRLLGSAPESAVVRALGPRLAHPLATGPDGGLAVPLRTGTRSLVELHARLFSAVRSWVEVELGRSVRRVVLTAPAGHPARTALRTAAALAGLEVVRIVSEPVAAAVAYGRRKTLAGRRLLVFRMGAGGAEAAVVVVSGDRFEVAGTAYDPLVGGLDLDERLADLLAGSAEAAGAPSLRAGRPWARLLSAAREAKEALSEADRHPVSLVELWTGPDGDRRDLHREVTCAELEASAATHLERAAALVTALLARLRLGPEQIDALVLAGGQTRMPALRERLAALLGRAPAEDAEGLPAELAAAVGAAELGAAVTGPPGRRAPSLELREVLGAEVLLELPDGRRSLLLEAGTPLPCERTLGLSTRRDGQPRLEVRLLEQPAGFPDAAPLGAVEVGPLPEMPAGAAPVRLRLLADIDGLLHLEARGEDGAAVEARLHGAGGASDPDAWADTRVEDPAAPGGALATDLPPAGVLGGLRRFFTRS